jgi:mRNA-degrading endonuclease toxin of MazEF toxin-antitoxin module
VPHGKRVPLRGEIWFVQLPTDPPEKGRRPVVIVSSDSRNTHERASTVLVIPLSTSIHKDAPTHLLLEPGQSGLREPCVAQSENIAVVRKESLIEPREPLRRISDAVVCEMADRVSIAMSCLT